MKKNTNDVTARELEAYMAGGLDHSTRAKIEHHLLRDPSSSDQVRADGVAIWHLRKLFAPILHEPIPRRMRDLITRS